MPLPTGTVTFLFTDIEGSTKLWETQPEAMSSALVRHDHLLYGCIERHEGTVFKTMGDAFCAAFDTVPQALAAALEVQQALRQEPWPADFTFAVRVALHTGTAEERNGDYFGPPLNRAARLLAAGHGGQILISQSAYELTRDTTPQGCAFEDLGAHGLRDLARREQIYQLLHPTLPSEFPPLRSLGNPELPNNLPQQLTSFIGRQRELADIRDLLTKTRLLTLTGSGGAGKTRLSLQVAADVLEDYPDGVWLIELAPVTEPALVPQTLASVLGVSDQLDQPLVQTLLEWLQHKSLLLIFDNCEHLLETAAGLVAPILAGCPLVRILASSREALNVAGERTYRVPSLSLPDRSATQTPENVSQYEAVRLFIARAISVKPDFVVTNANAQAVASVCHRVDGIPLALELAAARIRSLSVEEVNERLGNRFRLLTGGSRTALPRQQTLRALIDWSYDLLTDQEKSLLCRLSVFAGGWILEAAEAVGIGDDIEEWEVFDLLTSLVDKSLVNAEEDEGKTRYHLLQTVRQYGQERSMEDTDSEAVREKHAHFFLDLAEIALPQLSGANQREWMQRLELDHDNFRAALAWLLQSHDPDLAQKGLRLCAKLGRFWLARGYLNEGRRHLDDALSHPGTQTSTLERAQTLVMAGVLAQTQGDNSLAKALYTESLTVARVLGDHAQISDALGNLGTIVRNEGDFALAQQLGEESLALAREAGDRTKVALALSDLGMIAANQGDHSLARTRIEECLVIFREIGHKRAIAHFATLLGSIMVDLGDDAQGNALLEESLAVNRELGYQIGIALTLYHLGFNAIQKGEYARAQLLLEESIEIEREIGHKEGVANSLMSLAKIALDLGENTQALALAEECMTLQRELGHKKELAVAIRRLGQGAARLGNPARGQALVEESLRLHRELDLLHEIVGALLILAEIALDAGDVSVAQSRLAEALPGMIELDDPRTAVQALELYVLLAFTLSESGRAARLCGTLDTLRAATDIPIAPVDEAIYVHCVAESREILGENAFAAEWAVGAAIPWKQAVSEAMGE